MKLKYTVVVLGFIALVTSCNNNKGTNNQHGLGKRETSESPLLIEENQIGKELYQRYCLACHQSNGKGVPGMYPPISGTNKVNGDKIALIKIIINGLSGEIEVDGEIYNNVMPAHPMLGNEEVADLLTYLRSNFGNNSSAVTAEDVEQARRNSTN